MHRCASAVSALCKFVGRSGAVGVCTRCDDRSQHRRRQGRRLRALPRVKDRRARARRLLPLPRRGAHPGTRPMARLARHARAPRHRGHHHRRPRLHLADGRQTPQVRTMAAPGWLQRRSRRRDRPDLQRPQVGIRCVGARRRVPATQDRSRTRRSGQRNYRAPDRHRADRAPALPRAGVRGARPRRRGRRVPAHHRPRRPRDRRARPAAPQPCRHHERCPR